MYPITLSAVDILNSAIDTWNSFYEKIIAALTKSPASMFPDAWNIAKSVYSTTKGIGMALLVVFFYIGLAKSYIDLTQLRRPEKIFGIFLRFVFAKILVSYTGTILTDLLNLSRSIILSIMATLGSTSSAQIEGVPDNIVEACEDLGIFNGLVMDGICIIGWLVISACSIIMLLIVYTRFFKIYLYVAASPIPLASIAGEGTGSMAKHFIRSFIGVCLQGVTIAVACMIFAGIATSSINISDSDSAFTMMTEYLASLILNMLVLCALVKGADRVTRDMIGG